MVREIIHLQVGQCGNQVGCAFWEAVQNEHCLSSDGKFNADAASDLDNDGTFDELQKIGVYYRDTAGSTKSAEEGKYVPRAVIVDLEPGTVDVIKEKSKAENGNNFPQFHPDNMIWGNNGAGNNWAKGHYTEGAELVENVLEAVRKEIENCDAPQGFQIFHSLGGGTGSGMGTLLLLKIRDAYPDRLTTTYSIYPSPKVSDTVVEPYNAVLSTHQLLENADETFIIDNEALYNISHNVLKQSQPTYDQLNSLIAQVGCGITASLRFPGSLNSDLRKLGVNLVPFPRLHFFLCAQAPLQSKDASLMGNVRVNDLITQSFSPRNFFSNVKPDDGKYLAASLAFRGGLSTSDVDEAVDKYLKDRADDFVEWIPNNIKTGVCLNPPKTSSTSCTFVSNSTALRTLFQRLSIQFGAMYKRKAFLHWYKGEGMDEMEFQEAERNVRDLITEYQDKQDAVYEEDEEEDSAGDDEI